MIRNRYTYRSCPDNEEGRLGLQARSRPAAAVRSGEWKLIEYFEDGALELYNLADDVGESKNVALTLPDKTRELHEKMKEWRRSLQAPVPTRANPEYDPRK